MSDLKQQLIKTLNLNDEAVLADVKAIVNEVKPFLNEADQDVLDEAYKFQQNNPSSEIVWKTLTANFTLEQIESFIQINEAILDTLDVQSDKLMTILAKVVMDSETAQAYTTNLAEQQKQLH